MNTKYELVSAAAILLGNAPISDFTTSSFGMSAGVIYDVTIEGLLAEYPWTFLKAKRQLARLADAPLTKWRYAYQLPSDQRGHTFKVFCSDAVGSEPVQEWDIHGRTILTNYDAVWLDYIVNKPINEWPGYFTQLAIYELTWKLAPAGTRQNNPRDFWYATCRGTPSDEGKGGWMRQAQRQDAAQKPPEVMSPNQHPLIAARGQ